jgi:hypothetical protein
MKLVTIVLLHAAVLVLAVGVWAGAGSIAAQTADAPTFSRDVAPIFYNRCVSCHRPGEVAPMSLITFADVRPWAAAIRSRVLERAMPPWHADRRYGTFRNDTSLVEGEVETIVRWVAAGAPEGNPADLPRLPDFPQGWQIGTPDVVFEMPVEYDVPERGTIDYQYFEVPTNFTQDMWMQAGEVRPGDREHVHHIIVYVREPSPVARPTVMTVRPIVSGVAATATAAAAVRGRLVRPRLRLVLAAARRVTRGGDNMLVNWAVGEDAPFTRPGRPSGFPPGRRSCSRCTTRPMARRGRTARASG